MKNNIVPTLDKTLLDVNSKKVVILQGVHIFTGFNYVLFKTFT